MSQWKLFGSVIPNGKGIMAPKRWNFISVIWGRFTINFLCSSDCMVYVCCLHGSSGKTSDEIVLLSSLRRSTHQRVCPTYLPSPSTYERNHFHTFISCQFQIFHIVLWNVWPYIYVWCFTSPFIFHFVRFRCIIHIAPENGKKAVNVAEESADLATLLFCTNVIKP